MAGSFTILQSVQSSTGSSCRYLASIFVEFDEVIVNYKMQVYNIGFGFPPSCFYIFLCKWSEYSEGCQLLVSVRNVHQKLTTFCGEFYL